MIAEQDRQANARAHADMEFLAREVASLRMAVGEVATRDFLRSELRALLSDLDDLEASADDGRRAGDAEPPTAHWRHEATARLTIMSTPTHRAGRRPRSRPSTTPRSSARSPSSGWSTPSRSPTTAWSRVTVLLTVSGCPLKDTINRDVTAAVDARRRRHRRRPHPGRDDRRAARRLQQTLRGGQAPARDPVRPARLADQGLRHRQRQGRCRQVLGHGQPRPRAGQAGPQGRHRRRRHLRPLGPGHARHRRLPGRPRSRT